MEVGLSAEPEARRDVTARIVDRLGPRWVAPLQDPEQAEKLEAAVAANLGRLLPPSEEVQR